MAKLISEPMMSVHPEWVQDSQIRFRKAELERQAAERLQNDADRFEDETDKRTKRTLDDVDKKLEQRIYDIKYWNDEIEKKSEDIFKETDMLNTASTRMDKARSAVLNYLHLAEACKTNRTERYGIDLCADNAHFSLNKEIEIYKEVLKLLDKTDEQAQEQLRQNRKAKYRLDKDSLNKKAGLAVDSYCLDSKTHSKDIHGVSPNEISTKDLILLPDWMDLTNGNILNGERARMNSEKMRSLIDGVLQQIFNDMTHAVADTNLAFKKRNSELIDVKAKDEEHLNRILQEIKNTEYSLDDLKKCLDAKYDVLQLALHRLNQRNMRPGIESCLDEPHIRLNEEVFELKLDMANLKQRISDHEFQLKGLRRHELCIEEDIQSKSGSIYIDQVICLGIRESIVIKSF